MGDCNSEMGSSSSTEAEVRPNKTPLDADLALVKKTEADVKRTEAVYRKTIETRPDSYEYQPLDDQEFDQFWEAQEMQLKLKGLAHSLVEKMGQPGLGSVTITDAVVKKVPKV